MPEARNRKNKNKPLKSDPLGNVMSRFQDVGKANAEGAKTRGMMTPSSSNQVESWGTTFSNNGARRTALEYIIETAMLENTLGSLHPEGILINYVKAYCWWAIFTILRKNGNLVDSAGNGISESVMPNFPPQFHIPRAVAKALEYWLPYKSASGSTARMLLQLPAAGALPIFTTLSCLQRTNAAAIDASFLCSNWPQYYASTAAKWEMSFDEGLVVAPSWQVLFGGGNTAADISDWFSCNNGELFEKVLKLEHAPDASLHALPLVNSSANGSFRVVLSCFPKFNAEVAYILNGAYDLDPTNLPHPFSAHLPGTYSPKKNTTTNGDQLSFILGFTKVMNSAKRYRHGKAQWMFAETPYTGLNSFMCTQRQMDLSRWHQILANIIYHGLVSERTTGNRDLLNLCVLLQMLWEGCLVSRVMSSGGWVNLAGVYTTGVRLAQFVLPTAGYDNLELPALIADYISQIGPVVVHGGDYCSLQIPVLDWTTAPGDYQYNLNNILFTGGVSTPNLLYYVVTASMNNSTSFTRPFQFSLGPTAALSIGAFIGSYANTGRSKNLTVGNVCGTATTRTPIIFIDLLEMVMDTLGNQGAAVGTDGAGTVTTILNRKKFDIPSFNLPKPVGGSCCMLAEVLYVGGQDIVYNANATIMDNTSTAICIGVGPAATDFWYSFQQQLKAETVGSCAQWDQHQVGRIVSFGMFSSNVTRMDYLPFVVQVRGSEAVTSLIMASTTKEFKDRYLAEKEKGQPDAYAVRGALATHYTSVVNKKVFSSMPNAAFLKAVARNIAAFRTAPYYFIDGKPYAESGSWDWLEKIINFVTPIAEVVAAPFGMGGVVKGVSGGLLSLLGSDAPAQQSPVASAAATAVKAVHQHARTAHRHYKGKPPKQAKKGGNKKKKGQNGKGFQPPKGPMVRTQKGG